MKLSTLLNEVMVGEVPSQNSQVDFNIKNELEQFTDSIENYEKSAQEQFKKELSAKLLGKEVTSSNKTIDVSDIQVRKHNGEYIVILIGGKDKIALNSKSSLSIRNDSDAPVTNMTQNKSMNSDSSQHKIKQF